MYYNLWDTTQTVQRTQVYVVPTLNSDVTTFQWPLASKSGLLWPPVTMLSHHHTICCAVSPCHVLPVPGVPVSPHRV